MNKKRKLTFDDILNAKYYPTTLKHNILMKKGGIVPGIKKYENTGVITDLFDNEDTSTNSINSSGSFNESKDSKSKGVNNTIGAIAGGVNIAASALTKPGYDSDGDPYRTKEDAAYNTVKSGVSTIGPWGAAVGALMSVGDMIGNPIRAKSERTDERGNLKDESSFIRGNAIGSFLNPGKSVIASLSDKDAPSGEWALGPFAAKQRAKRFEERSRNSFLEKRQDELEAKNLLTNSASLNPIISPVNNKRSVMFAEGGIIPNYTPINVEKDELLVNDKGDILKEYKNKPPHPKTGINTLGNTMETVGNIIIPKKYSKMYKNGDLLRKSSILMNLKFK